MRVKNWAKFQHFKDRNPPWIKLYREILDDPDFHELDGDSAKVLMMLWLIASEDEKHEGNLPDARKLAFRMRITESKLKQSLTKLSHWVEQSDINVISTRYQLDAPETETETETEERQRQNSATATRLPTDWLPTIDDLNFCQTQRPDLNPQEVAAGFRDYWIAQPGAKGRKLDWSATWRNWVRNQKQVRQSATDQRAANVAYLTGQTRMLGVAQ